MQNKNAEKEFFDNASSASPWTTFNKHGQEQIFKVFEKTVQPKAGEVAVDMGCGTGEFSIKLREYGLNVTGIDISEKSIAYCNKTYCNKTHKDKGAEISFEVQDIEKTKWKNESVDIIFLGGVLHHFPRREKVFEEAYRILKKGGRIYAFDPNYYNLIIWAYRELLGVKTQKTENEVLIKAADTDAELKAAGFQTRDVKATASMTFDIRYFKKLVPFPLWYGAYFYNGIERTMQYIKPLHEKHGSFVITYAKK
jgi:ubiquinone/menaquinone biosynthesis C-methylase UbiE